MKDIQLILTGKTTQDDVVCWDELKEALEPIKDSVSSVKLTITSHTYSGKEFHYLVTLINIPENNIITGNNITLDGYYHHDKLIWYASDYFLYRDGSRDELIIVGEYPTITDALNVYLYNLSTQLQDCAKYFTDMHNKLLESIENNKRSES